jgi:hypothetical protein
MGGSSSGYTGNRVDSLAFFQGQDLRKLPKQFSDQLELRIVTVCVDAAATS